MATTPYAQPDGWEVVYRDQNGRTYVLKFPGGRSEEEEIRQVFKRERPGCTILSMIHPSKKELD